MGTIILQDGSIIKGNSFGAISENIGEIIFNTSSTGYQEIISDPANSKQIVVMAYPEIGNIGINDSDFESDFCNISGLIIKNYCRQESHYKAQKSLQEYLIQKNIVALENIDTRSLIKKITTLGTMPAYISSYNLDDKTIKEKLEILQNYQLNKNILDEVSCKSKYIFNPNGKINLAFIDLGTRKSEILTFAEKNCKLTIYSANTNAEEILNKKFDAIILSSGPENPNEYQYQIEQIKRLLGKIPMFGIGLGCELLAIASGARVLKSKQGHRGNNYPVINLENNKVIITSQNHSYKIDKNNISKIMRPTYKNLNDDEFEGFEISSLSVYAVQFYIEYNKDSNDTSKIIEEWINIIYRNIKKVNEVKNER